MAKITKTPDPIPRRETQAINATIRVGSNSINNVAQSYACVKLP